MHISVCEAAWGGLYVYIYVHTWHCMVVVFVQHWKLSCLKNDHAKH